MRRDVDAEVAASASAASDGWLVACLCAEWCGACRAFRADFDAVLAVFPEVRFDWIDIEDHPEVLGDDEVDTFPTVLIVDAAGRGFLGPIEPRRSTLHALVASALRGDHAGRPVSARLSGVAERVVAGNAASAPAAGSDDFSAAKDGQASGD